MGRTGRQGEEGSNKENNPLSVNCLATRRKYALRNQPRPLTSNFEATFNPFPHPNAFSIPLLPARAATIDHSEHTEQQSLAHELCLHIARQQKGPIIARNGKLKSFFHPDTGRYARRESVPDPRTARSLRGCSLDALNTRAARELTLLPPKPPTRRQQFQRAYRLQKEGFEQLLRKHGVAERIEE